MAKTNYSFEKRQKELAKKKKKEEKRLKRFEKNSEKTQLDHLPLADDRDAPINNGG